MKFHALSDIGKCRGENQDCYGRVSCNHAFLAVVCDGMGGAAAGRLAAKTVADCMTEEIEGTLMRRGKDKPPMTALEIKRLLWASLDRANRQVYEMAAADDALNGMGTTLVAAFFYYGQVYTVHVGDSRAYLYREGQLKRLTRDHSLVQGMVDAGTLTEEEARVHPSRNVITRAVGVSDAVTAEYGTLPIRAGDRFLLCTDGLTGLVPDARITSFFEAGKSDEVTAGALVNEALSAGGEDNVTVFLVSAGEEDVYSVWDALADVRTEEITATFERATGEVPEVRTGREEFE